jgi:hypothetical protein
MAMDGFLSAFPSAFFGRPDPSRRQNPAAAIAAPTFVIADKAA